MLLIKRLVAASPFLRHFGTCRRHLVQRLLRLGLCLRRSREIGDLVGGLRRRQLLLSGSRRLTVGTVKRREIVRRLLALRHCLAQFAFLVQRLSRGLLRGLRVLEGGEV